NVTGVQTCPLPISGAHQSARFSDCRHVAVAESQEIATRASQAGLVTSVGFNYRHVPAIAEARRLVRAGEIGTINNVRVSFKADYSADPLGALTWRFKKELAGSGVLGDLMSQDRKSTRLNSSHVSISYAVFCLKKKIG